MVSIVVMRHGDAERQATTDRARMLTEQGRHDASCAALQLSDFIGDLAQITSLYHSPFVRTTETAHQVLGAVPSLFAEQVSPIAEENLLGDKRAEQVLCWIEQIDQRTTSNQCIMLVSHQPLVSDLLAWMIDGERGSGMGVQYPMATSSLAVVDAETIGRGCFSLRALLHCA